MKDYKRALDEKEPEGYERGIDKPGYESTVSLEVGDKHYDVPVRENDKLTSFASYLLRHNHVLTNLNRARGGISDLVKSLPPNVKVSIYEGKLPNFNEIDKGKFSGATVNNNGDDDYQIVVDQRLGHDEKIAVLSHELGHLFGGHKENGRMAHLMALQLMAGIATSYDIFANKDNAYSLKHTYGIDLNTIELPKDSIMGALQYLVKGSGAFGLSADDLQFVEGLEVPKNFRMQSDLEKILGVVLGALSGLSLLIALFFTTNLTGNIIGTTFKNFYGAIFFCLALFFAVNLIFLKKRPKLPNP